MPPISNSVIHKPDDGKRMPNVAADGNLERLPGHLQRDLGVAPDMPGARHGRAGQVSGIESPRMVRARLVAAWPELQR